MHRRVARTLAAALGAALLAPAGAGAWTITATPAEEGDGVVFEVTREPGDPLTPVTATPAPGTATPGADFDGEAQTVPAAVPSHEITVETFEDEIDEGDGETLRLVVQGDEGTGTITDDDPPPALSVADVSVPEGGGPAKLAIAASRPSSQDVVIPLSGAAGTAAAADFTVPASVTLRAGQTAVEAQVAIADDVEDEVDETFSVVLGTPANATVADGEAVVTIVDDDLRFAGVDDVSTLEGDDGTAIARFTIRLNGPTFRTVTVGYLTLDGTARAPGDYLARLGTVTIPPGQVAAVVDVPVVGDDRREDAESFAFGLTGATGARIGDGAAVGVIVDDDSGAPPGTAPGGGSGPAGGDERPPQMTLRGPRASGRRITLRVACPSGERTCTGRMTLFTVPDRRSRVRSLRRERRIGRATFRLRGGRATTLAVTVPRSLLLAARRARRLKVQAFVVTRDAAGNVDTREVGATLRYRARRRA
jgi:hypothetical protein